MSAESSIATFRDAGGLWEQHSIEEVATPHAWKLNPGKVLRFYNERRKQLMEVSPNEAHEILASLQHSYKLKIITQNVDNLHERAGSQHVLHLHGELMKAESEIDPNYIVELDNWEVKLGDCCPQGGQLRPHVVWFGEPVPKMEEAFAEVATADFLIVIGTSLEVYPAAGLVTQSANEIPKLIIDPGTPAIGALPNTYHLKATASEGLRQLKSILT